MLFNDPAASRDLLAQLERAGDGHARWHEQVIRAICCRLPPDPRDLGGDAHLDCSFGQWYYRQSPLAIRDHPAFAAMRAEHERVHRAAARMLRAAAAATPVAPADFDEYASARAGLALELDSLRHEIEGMLRNRDTLTGARRRLDLLQELGEAHELARRGVQTCCIAFMDLDHFKVINDTRGHRVGDEVLARAVAFVMEHLRPFDKVFRYGGDEFLVTMPGTDLANGRAVIERMREGLATRAMTPAGDTPLRVTASFGVALLDPQSGVEESIERADRALLAAKAAGRNRACCWDPADAAQTASFPAASGR